MLAEMLAGGLNANLGGRDHAPIEMERQVIAWAAEMLISSDRRRHPGDRHVDGNLIGVLTARTDRLGPAVRQAGLGGAPLTVLRDQHGCISRAMEIAGSGDALRMVPCDPAGSGLTPLARAGRADRRDGATPFLVVASAGTVDIGAIDDLDGLAAFRTRENMWFHAMLAPALRPLLRASQRPIWSASISINGRRCSTTPAASSRVILRPR